MDDIPDRAKAPPAPDIQPDDSLKDMLEKWSLYGVELRIRYSFLLDEYRLERDKFRKAAPGELK